MRTNYLVLIFFFYGLAFFSMGLVILQEVGRCANARLRHALYYLAAFGILHGIHEWIEMFEILGMLPAQLSWFLELENLRLLILALSFLPLGGFGAALIIPSSQYPRLVLLTLLVLSGIWSFGLIILSSHYPAGEGFADIIDVWTRYVLAIPSALLACLGLILQQRAFRREGLAQFGQDSLWAAMAFGWYGLIGQLFTRPSQLPPSNVLNSVLFQAIFGLPVQLLRGVAAVVAAIFVIRFLRSFEVETQMKIAELQAARLGESQRREALRGELLRRVVAAQEAERQRIARELHDETGQALTALGLGIRATATAVRQDPEKALQHLRSLESLTARSINELQRLIADLRPSHLDDLGLPAALRWYCGEIQERSGLHVNLEITGDVKELPTEMKTALFRVAQEAMTNVIKHAHARHVSIRLDYLVDVVFLEIEDDGCGFNLQLLERARRASWGLIGMEERATLLGGKLEILTEPGCGTRVRVTIPYHHAEEVDDDYPTGISG